MGQRALVVGASSGIGAATVQLLTQREWRVVAAARRSDRLEKLPSSARTECVDVSDENQARELVRKVVADGPLDVLVYSAGLNVPKRRMAELDTRDWEAILRVNVTGAYWCLSEAISAFRARGGGLAILVSSVSAVSADQSGAAYQASKRAMVGLAHATTQEEWAAGVRVSVVFAGLTDTDFVHHRPSETPRAVLDRALRPEDVAAAIVFLAELPKSVHVPEMQILPSAIGPTEGR